jgi:predicted ATPase
VAAWSNATAVTWPSIWGTGCWSTQHARALELRAAMSLGRLLQRQGKPEEARGPLVEVYAWFSEGFATEDLTAAAALLEELSVA